jgi:hypothetical protein
VCDEVGHITADGMSPKQQAVVLRTLCCQRLNKCRITAAVKRAADTDCTKSPRI